MTCPACDAAVTNPYVGEYHEGCIGCATRYTSQQPRERRELILNGITDPEARARFLADCVAEYRRRETLKAERPLQ